MTDNGDGRNVTWWEDAREGKVWAWASLGVFAAMVVASVIAIAVTW